jgi:hypothetical protein
VEPGGSDLVPILFDWTDCVQPIVFDVEGVGKKLETWSDPVEPAWNPGIFLPFRL